jgi:hypothetical protein
MKWIQAHEINTKYGREKVLVELQLDSQYLEDTKIEHIGPDKRMKCQLSGARNKHLIMTALGRERLILTVIVYVRYGSACDQEHNKLLCSLSIKGGRNFVFKLQASLLVLLQLIQSIDVNI